jgi:hypothetical protein
MAVRRGAGTIRDVVIRMASSGAAGGAARGGSGAGAAAALSARGAAKLFIGLDSSTQGLKATVIDESLNVVTTAAVNYQAGLPHYGTSNGVHLKPGAVVTQPTLMVRRGRGADGG